MKKMEFKVSLSVPDGCHVRLVRDYIEEAVAVWRGQTRPPGGYGPDDPGDPV